MDNVLIDLGFIKIYWYSFMILIGIVFGYIYSMREIKRIGIPKEKFENLIFYTIIIGLLGARIYYVLFNLDYYLKYPSEIIMIWHGGLAIHGGIIAGLLVIYFYCKKNKLDLYKVIDVCVPFLLFGQICGRWGNFFNQEAYGSMVSLEFLKGLHLPDFIINGMHINGNYYHPTFLYESLSNFIVLIFILIIRKKNIKESTITGVYLTCYGVIRFFIEGLRTDSLMFFNLRIAQIVSILFFISGIVILILSKKKGCYNRVK